MTADRFTEAQARSFEEAIYAQVAQEIASGIRRDGLWAKAIAETGGSIEAAKARYVRLRAQSLFDELRVSQRAEQEQRQRQEAAQRRQDIAEREVHRAVQRKLRAEETGKQIGRSANTLWMVLVAFVTLISALIAAASVSDLFIGNWDSLPGALICGFLSWWGAKKLYADVR